MADHIVLSYSYTPKPESMDGSLLLELDTGRIFVRINGDWQPFRYFQTRFVDLWLDLPLPPPGVWAVTALDPWVPANGVAVQIIVQTTRLAGGPERKVTFGLRGRGSSLERKTTAVVRTGLPPFRTNFIPLIAQLHAERTVELFQESEGPDAVAIFTLAGYFFQGE